MKKIINKNKIIPLWVALSLLGSGINAFAQESTNSEPTYNEYAYNSANVLTTSLAGGDLFEAEADKLVTRGEFVKAVTKLFNVSGFSQTELPYKDVTEESNCFEAVKTAYAMGWISSADNFYPDKEILYPEALKIMFHAVNYEVFINTYGTYPTGYISMANDLDITENVRINSDQTVNAANAQIMLYNLLHAEAGGTSGVGTDRPIYELGAETNLESLYEISYFEGIVTSTGSHSIIMNDEISIDEPKVSIDGEVYLSQWLEPELLGKQVRAYYYDDESGSNTLCCVVEKANRNEEKTVSVKDFNEISNSRLYYNEDSGRKKSLNLDEAYKVVYNGRRVSKLEDYMLENNAKSIRLLCNDGDGEYEIIFIDGYVYGYVTGVNTFDEEIGIKLPGETIYLNSNNEKSVKNIYDANGNEIELFELPYNVVVGVKKSDDGCLYEVRVCQDMIYGKVVSVDTEDKIIKLSKKEYVDSRELDARYEEKVTTYEISNEFITEYANKVKIGDELSAILGLYGEVVYLNSGAYTMEYGFLQKVFTSDDNGGDEYYLRILEMNGEFGKYKLSEKTVVDGVTKKSGEAFNIVNKDFSPQVIRYSRNSNGEVNVIDFATSDVSGFGQTPENSKDNLVKFYSKGDTALRYRSGCRGFSSVGLLLNTQILFVPNNDELLGESENYSIGDYNAMISDNTYSVELYNIDEFGMVGFAAIYIDVKTPPKSRSLESCFISKITAAYNDEKGEVGREIVCRYNNKFTTYFIPESVKIKKTSGEDICVGDIVRVYADDDGIVKNIFVDYDFSSGSAVYEDSSEAQELETGNASLVFVKGKLFSQGASSYVLCNSTQDGYDYSYNSLRPYYATGNIILFDSTTKEFRNITKSELKTYQGYGDECDFVIIRQNYTSPSVMFVIR